jgi:DNA replication protein DnaC
MTAFLRTDRCIVCREERPWEWVPTVALGGKPLPGTGVWSSQLLSGQCPTCFAVAEIKHQKEQQAQARREGLVRLMGGEKPYREFTFERFQVTSANRAALEKAKHFCPQTDNLYFWGSCGVGKTHLAYAIARQSFEQDQRVGILLAPQLTRKLRMKDPETEQQSIDGFIRLDTWVLDDLGMGNETAYARQILQEILDGRDFRDRRGLVVTSKYSLSGLAQKLNDDTIPSRLAGMCRVVEVKGTDHRLPLPDRLNQSTPWVAQQSKSGPSI